MKFLQRIRLLFAVVSLPALVVVFGFAQTTPQASEQVPSTSVPLPERPAVVLRVRVLLAKDYPALEIVTDRPVVPSIHKLDGPSRLTIDLPNSSMSLEHKEIPINTDQLGSLHLDEERGANQAVHMFIDLRKPLAYTWEAAGNRLTIRLQSTEPVAATPAAVAPAPAPIPSSSPSVPGLPEGSQVGLVPVTPGGFGSVIFAGNRVEPGSTITAGTDTAVLSLGRNGEVHLCPRTTVSVTTSSNGHDLMLGMSMGSLETHYNLDASINSVLTPDFRILLAGPGIFQYAISADAHGNTCVGALPGNTRSAIVSELIGTGSYEVKPSEQVMFHSGRLSAADNNMIGSCGCATPAPVMRASAGASTIVPDSKLPSSVQLAQAGSSIKPDAAMTGTGTQAEQHVPSPGSETNDPPASKPNDIQAQVEAPLIFRASDLPPAKTTSAAKPKDSTKTATPPAATQRVAPPRSTITITTTEKQHHGFFGKVKGFFKTIFS